MCHAFLIGMYFPVDFLLHTYFGDLAGAQEIEPLEAEEIPEGQKGARFLTEIKDLDHVAKALKAAGWNIIASEMRYIAKNFTEVAPADRKSVSDFLTALDDHDDVHRVYAAFK